MKVAPILYFSSNQARSGMSMSLTHPGTQFAAQTFCLHIWDWPKCMHGMSALRLHNLCRTPRLPSSSYSPLSVSILIASISGTSRQPWSKLATGTITAWPGWKCLFHLSVTFITPVCALHRSGWMPYFPPEFVCSQLMLESRHRLAHSLYHVRNRAKLIAAMSFSCVDFQMLYWYLPL